jgi:hypothetical protein
MLLSNSIRLFWWNEVKLQKKKKENYGDLLGKYLVEKISKKKVIWVKPSSFSIFNFFKPIYVTAGSILAHINRNCIVWGSGIISNDQTINNAKFIAVRGPQTRNFLLKLGYDVPEVYGDPGILLPKYYLPEFKTEYKFGIVPHYNDFNLVKDIFSDNADILVIDLMTNNIESTTDQFLKCERIISSSLHGIIIAHAYKIPAVWQRFSDVPFGDNIKFQDYFESVKIKPYLPDIRLPDKSVTKLERQFEKLPSLPEEGILEELSRGLMKVCPFN